MAESCDKFFHDQRIAEVEVEVDKVGLAAFHMIREAQIWIFKPEEEESRITWDTFKNYCHLHFGPPLRNNPLGELAKLKQTSSVEENKHKFQALLARVHSITGTQQVEIFTTGLTELIRINVELQNPPNLTMAMSLARTFKKGRL